MLQNPYRASKAEVAKVLGAVNGTYREFIRETGCTLPKLQHVDGNWQIIWDQGPEEWTIYFTDAVPSGVSDGKTYTVSDSTSPVRYPAPTGIPEHLLLESQNAYVLGVFRR